ncbi:hypothetical protein GO013_14965 [Pseudodesulfovibrio sp. JC047]|uniref:hypothetical protein n=1 Tax=Pseudodesulfovibrio sp. JC047 TaxID=2683199 RepID=UPI0013D829B9|nr:hypothetical protein [Pseudodesulfovibrio sp. JC047]NDV20710.1 hypothetical protein [Pseudodesulfovibrio sp. JC047]
MRSFKQQELPHDTWRSIKRMIEAWVYILVLIATSGGCAYTQTWWPIYPVVGILGILLWFRRV